MANTEKDLLVFLEYYADKSSVLDGSNKRNPTKLWQNFFQVAQLLSGVDSDGPTSEFFYLAFDANGFGNVEAGGVSDLSINLAATAEIVDLTDTAIGGDRLVIASLYIQNTGFDSIQSNAQLISRYTGTIDSVSLTDETASWSVSPAISKQKAQVPSRRIVSDLLGRFEGR